jgi:hypothetical protein
MFAFWASKKFKNVKNPLKALLSPHKAYKITQMLMTEKCRVKFILVLVTKNFQ